MEHQTQVTLTDDERILLCRLIRLSSSILEQITAGVANPKPDKIDVENVLTLARQPAEVTALVRKLYADVL